MSTALVSISSLSFLDPLDTANYFPRAFDLKLSWVNPRERAFGFVSATRNIFNLAGHQGLHCALRTVSSPPLHGGKGITRDERSQPLFPDFRRCEAPAG